MADAPAVVQALLFDEVDANSVRVVPLPCRYSEFNVDFGRAALQINLAEHITSALRCIGMTHVPRNGPGRRYTVMIGTDERKRTNAAVLAQSKHLSNKWRGPVLVFKHAARGADFVDMTDDDIPYAIQTTVYLSRFE